MNEEQDEEARLLQQAKEIWITNIDREVYIYDPDEVSDKLASLDIGTVL